MTPRPGSSSGTAKAPIHRYRFPPQETEIRGGKELCNLGGVKLGKVEAISFADNTVDIKKRQDTAGLHPQAVFAHSYIGGQVMAEALVRIGAGNPTAPYRFNSGSGPGKPVARSRRS